MFKGYPTALACSSSKGKQPDAHDEKAAVLTSTAGLCE